MRIPVAGTCAWCGAGFVTSVTPGSVPLYCSPAHRRAYQRKKRPRAPECPRPDKRRFNSKADAESYREQLVSTPYFAGILQAYRCKCLRWHVGRPIRVKLTQGY